MKLMREHRERAVYEIRVAGVLDPGWSEWFDGLTIVPESGDETWLTGPVRDQAALHGILRKLHDMGLPLLAVNRIDAPLPPEK